ncbi:MAG TPA: hypothetical protein VK729_15080 [Silvibacterium sp.]|nr:hypothetical protein [Silvibacterium sp.]
MIFCGGAQGSRPSSHHHWQLRRYRPAQGRSYPLNIKKGDTLYVTETPDGVQLTLYDEKFVHVMEAANQIMRENRDVLRKLAE